MPKPKNDKIQLHVEMERGQYWKLQAALKTLGYRTISELVREHVRRVIAEARLTALEEEQPIRARAKPEKGKMSAEEASG